jgi:hypothetical protein
MDDDQDSLRAGLGFLPTLIFARQLYGSNLPDARMAADTKVRKAGEKIVTKNLEKLEQEVEATRASLDGIRTLVKELTPSYPPERFQSILAQLADLHSKLDGLDAELFNEAVLKDKPDDPIVTF